MAQAVQLAGTAPPKYEVWPCGATRLSRWIGVLEVESQAFEDATPRFVEQDDPFLIRMKIRPIVILEPGKSIPIRDDAVWDSLSFTKGQSKQSSTWTGKVRGSLNTLSKEDGLFLEKLLINQANNGRSFPLDDDDLRKMQTHHMWK